jgi:tetratricopeptide (TPR) repeat protein
MRRTTVLWIGALCACASAPRPAAQSAAELPPPPASPEPPPAAAHAEHPQVQPWTLDVLAEGAQLLGDLGKVQRKVSTQSVEAQAFFDQGLALTYGFNHDEAARSFAHAAALDPGCALCFWGIAYTLGPNYNIPMLPERAQAAWQAVQAAQAAAGSVTPIEQALIGALAKRFKGPEWLDPVAMAPFNAAYADAMREVAKRYPEDHDVQVLFAEALMNMNPWKLWTPQGEPAAGTASIVSTLEFVLARDPKHAGANHFYIHAVEASKTPDRALAAADRLAALVPGAGHIVHMPAHIYQRVGRYADASKANRRAAEVDEAYLKRVTPPGYYAMYTAHNYGFLAYSASMQGRSAEALEAARKSAQNMPRDLVCGMPGMDFFLSEPLLVMVRFGHWEALLKEPQPEAKYPVLVGLWHHGQGMALAATGKPEQARAEAQAIRALAAGLPPELLAGLSSAKDVLDLAAKVVDARAADALKDPAAVGMWEAAVALEDNLAYSEPADWFYPTRHYLGAALLDAGDAPAAEAVFRADLEHNPQNGWALFGLSQALGAQAAASVEKKKSLKETEKAFKRAWKEADIKLTRAAF